MTDYTENDILFLEIYPHKDCLYKIKKYISRHEKRLAFYLYFCNKNRWEPALKKSPMFKLCLVYLFLPTVKTKYKEKGISDSIFYDTMTDIAIWIDDHKQRTGETGLYELNWIMHHMNLNIFKLGRLQFQKCSYYFSPSYKKNGLSIKLSDKAINMHIPRGEPLNIEKCKESVEAAVKFFKKYYPEYPTNFFMCHSWMLYSKNKDFMSPQSNIIKFSNMFTIVKEDESPSQAYLWIFGKKVSSSKLLSNKKKYGNYGFTDELPTDTSLQRSALEYIKKGGVLGDAMCLLIL